MMDQSLDWLDEVQQKLHRKNQMLFSKETPILQELSFLITKEDRRALVLWALELAQEDAEILQEQYPEEQRPQQAVAAARQWASGKIKMPQAKPAILSCHALARELTSPEEIALCHAIGQGCSVVHTPRHALGLPIYELTSIVRRAGIENCRKPVEQRAIKYVGTLLYWHANWKEFLVEWAAFLCR